MDEIRYLTHVSNTCTAAQLNAMGGFFAARRDMDFYSAVHSRMQTEPTCGERGGFTLHAAAARRWINQHTCPSLRALFLLVTYTQANNSLRCSRCRVQRSS